MKLKFSADKKDWKNFAIFAIILLYVVAIALLNLEQFAFGDVDHPLHGLNPLPAFAPSHIGVTLVCYVAALVASVLSVKDKFFDREKGFGFSTEAKKETGYAKWESEEKMKNALTKINAIDETTDAAGVPLVNDGKHLWIDDGEYHNLVIGSTGSGKTEMIVQPLIKVLAKKGESMIITDPKGEIYERNGRELKERGYNVVVLNFRDPQKGSGWNPLTLPYELYKNGNKDKANELIDDLAANILYDENAQNQDPFWEKTSADYFSGITLALFEDATEEEINLNSVNTFTTVGEEKSGPSTFVQKYFNMKDHNSPAYTSASSTLIAPNETKGSILSVFKQKLRPFAARENISEMLSHSDFDMKDIGKKKTAVFIVIQDEKKTYHSLVTIFLKQCYETLIDVAQENGGSLEYRTNFILDEFANMPPLKDITTMITAARSRKIRFTMIVQNLGQLKQVYGEHDAETIRGNCGNLIYLLSTELASLEEISKLCGEVKSKEKDKTASTPLVTVSDLQRFPKWTVIVIRWRMMPFKTKLTPNWQMIKNGNWGKNYDKADYPHREKNKIHIFDLKGFVNKKNEERINELIKTGFNGKIPAPGMAGATTASKESSVSPVIPKKNKPIDVNDMIKKIDARIAELEAEEKAEQEKKKSQTNVRAKGQAFENVVGKIEPIQVAKKVPRADIIEKNNTVDKNDISAKEEALKMAKKPAMVITPKEEIKSITKEEKDKKKKQKEDFAAKITAKVNNKESNLKIEPKHEVKLEVKNETENKPNIEIKHQAEIKPKEHKTTEYKDKSDFITDDQFFDDFFADDEDYY